MAFCSQCGSANRNGTKFCAMCGTGVSGGAILRKNPGSMQSHSISKNRAIVIFLLCLLIGSYPLWLAIKDWRGADYNFNGVITPEEANQYLGELGIILFEPGLWNFETKSKSDLFWGRTNAIGMNSAKQLNGLKSLSDEDAVAYFNEQRIAGISLFPDANSPCVYEEFDVGEIFAGSRSITTDTRCDVEQGIDFDDWGAGKKIYSGTPGFLKIDVIEPGACFVGSVQSLGMGNREKEYNFSFRASRGAGCDSRADYFDNW